MRATRASLAFDILLMHRRRLIPIDLLALVFLSISIFGHWPSGLHDFKGWAIRTVFAMLSIFAVVVHFVVNARRFKTLSHYIWATADAFVLILALLWQLNLLIGLQGMS